MIERRVLRVRGIVQGVGFRPWAYRHATALGLAGRATNDRGGLVVEVEGPPRALDALERRLRRSPPPLADVTSIEVTTEPPLGALGFVIEESVATGAPAIAVPADVATCAPCLREVDDPADRRYRYPFVNCTDCGPRYTIILGIPYDRARTTMAGFPLCPDCDREYHDPADRRFHAQPLACPRCGPQLAWVVPDDRDRLVGDEALRAAVDALRHGGIVAIKGVGGYHLATDATSESAVAELRRRKTRDDKPFAVMARDPHQAEELVELDAVTTAALLSPRRPVVVGPRRPGALLARTVAPGLAEVGVMVPYSALHHLILTAVGRPLVMTSGNLSDEPIAYDDADAQARLGPIVDGLLMHDRPIEVRCDDSVVRAVRGGSVVIRRSRGYAPQPLALPVPGAPLLAVGAQLKNTVAVARGGSVVASHHIGDLDHPAAHASFLQAIHHLCRLTGVVPELVAHDLHPEYRSTQHAQELDLPLIGVQHHHAHVASCLVEHGAVGPVLGVAFDGLGLGQDGGLWGGELLVADLVSSRRVGHLRRVPLPGGDRAARQPWRMLLAWVDAALGAADAAALGPSLDPRWEAVHALIRRPDTPSTSSAGRLFDAVAALAGLRLYATYEGQAAMELEAAAAAGEVLSCDDVALIRATSGLVMDPGPLLVALLRRRAAGASASDVAATFHDRLGAGVVAAAARVAADEGLDVVALSGGVFQNVRLTDAVRRGLEAKGLRVLTHSAVPPNDGGIAIGQAAVASARAAESRS